MDIDTRVVGELLSWEHEGIVETRDEREMNVDIRGIKSLDDIDDLHKALRSLFKTLIPKV